MDPRLLIVLYAGVAVLPLALAWAGARPPRSVWDELATGAGMLAFSVILVEFVLSGRFRAVSGRITPPPRAPGCWDACASPRAGR